jgi:hypothetical protein
MLKERDWQPKKQKKAAKERRTFDTVFALLFSLLHTSFFGVCEEKQGFSDWIWLLAFLPHKQTKRKSKEKAISIAPVLLLSCQIA